MKEKKVTLPQQKMREIIFEILYTYEFQSGSDEELIALMMKEHKISKRHILNALSMVKTIQENQKILDEYIQKVSHDYSLERIQTVERTILRLCVYEILVAKTIPEKVGISEAKRLARKFSTPDAARFVHGIIDGLISDKGKLIDV